MATFLFFFFLSREQSCKRNMISLVAMGTEMDEDVSRFSGCLVAARVCQRARVSPVCLAVHNVNARVQ